MINLIGYFLATLVGWNGYLLYGQGGDLVNIVVMGLAAVAVTYYVLKQEK